MTTDTKKPAYSHKGVAIEFDPAHAVFRAKIDKKSITAASLDAIKKRIDALKRFEPFDCYVEITGWEVEQIPKAAIIAKENYAGSAGRRYLVLAKGVVTGINRGSRFAANDWVVAVAGYKKDITTRTVLPVTDDALKAWQDAATADRIETEREYEARQSIIALKAKIPWKREGETD